LSTAPALDTYASVKARTPFLLIALQALFGWDLGLLDGFC